MTKQNAKDLLHFLLCITTGVVLGALVGALVTVVLGGYFLAVWAPFFAILGLAAGVREFLLSTCYCD